MALPVMPPVEPQLARAKSDLPEGEQWVYEQKYDGFRALAFVDGDDLLLQSRGSKPLTRYFPELHFPAGRYVLDGEIVIDSAVSGVAEEQDFGALQQRIHPADSRIQLLAEQTPARYVAFDLLAVDDESLLDVPFAERRRRLAEMRLEGIDLTPLVTTAQEAEPWLHRGEGVMAKDLRAPYSPGKRTNMVKVKRVRTIDAVVAGYRPGKESGTVGALILGLYDQSGQLRVVGHSSGFRAAEKRALLERLRPYETGLHGSAEASRWKADKELEWVELSPELVVEITFDHVSGGRIRHGTRILRWRDDKAAGDCGIEQLES